MTPPVVFSPLIPTISLLIAFTVPVSGTIDVRSGTIERPPLDKPLFAIQIGSIVASYVIFVAVLLALLLFVGRRLRRSVHSSNYSLQMEILRPIKPPPSIDPSPVSPIAQSIPSPSKSKSSRFISSWGSLPALRPSQSSINGSMVTVDESIVASDRRRAQDEMEMLYAAVMEYDAQKASGVDISAGEADFQTKTPDSQYSNPFTDRHALQLSEIPPAVPPKSPNPFNSSRLSKLFSSRSGSNPDMGRLKSPKFSVRKMNISSPLASPDTSAPTYLGHEQPLSPRLYNPGPPPAAPSAGLRMPSAVAQVLPRPSGRARPPAPLTLATTPQSTSSLPFRDAYPDSLKTAPATKTTILERPDKNRGPITGVPTPYTPYMPFTPVTPFTPGRIVSKRQRKREERSNGLRVLNEDDLVKDDDDIWG
ncbi:hypothetical protein N7495_005503 [Penicillium taxi]|uniref:uncharacterized protein n=1 Tax=Penicillium taxi TaxID=168475 RepID=UPI0025457C82|nr:uncharacterized protein N7495_005503 [Penicillium taxi]KAJ5893812.1 hypothetical protein N7495_005503 [Penicillium taxi]